MQKAGGNRPSDRETQPCSFHFSLSRSVVSAASVQQKGSFLVGHFPTISGADEKEVGGLTTLGGPGE